MALPECKELLLFESKGVLTITLNRPEVRNAMNLVMVDELMHTFNAIADKSHIRIVVIKGADSNFCSGGDIRDMVNARTKNTDKGQDAFYDLNRAFGRMISLIEKAPQVVITLLEGAVLGGGFGLACISDIAIADSNCQFGLPETGLGLPPAQIAPFVVKRIGLTQARRLVLTGARFNGKEAKKLGVVHFSTKSEAKMQQLLQQQIRQIKRCAPDANRITKELILDVGVIEHERLLDKAARTFATAVKSEEGQEGTSAFIEKRPANWVD